MSRLVVVPLRPTEIVFVLEAPGEAATLELAADDSGSGRRRPRGANAWRAGRAEPR